jgi:hypothetical protein
MGSKLSHLKTKLQLLFLAVFLDQAVLANEANKIDGL